MTDTLQTVHPLQIENDADDMVLTGTAFLHQLPLTETRPVFVRQARQELLVEGLGRLLADIYGQRQWPAEMSPLETSYQQLGFIFESLSFDAMLMVVLRQTYCQPIANKLVDRLAHRLALTAEGQKQFNVIKLQYGLSGDTPVSHADIATMGGMTTKEVKHLSIMMRCRLESDTIRQFVEDTLRLLADEFRNSEAYHKIIAASRQFAESGKPDILQQRAALAELDHKASSIMAELDKNPTVNIEGKAGTGKTTLALKLTAQLLEQGKRVLYVCHSRFLAQHIQSLTRFYEGDLTVSTFHALCHLYAKQADIEIPSFRSNKVFNELFPELLIQAMHIRRENAFDAIIVDEGHSLLPNFWRALKFCLKDLQAGTFIYFYDPLVMGLARNKQAPFAVQNLILNKELRPNFNLLNHSLLNHGDSFELYETISKEEANAAVSRVIATLISAGYNTGDIAILSADSVPKVSANRYSLPRGVRLAATPGDRTKYVLYTSLASFRALTKKVIILTVGKEVEDLPSWKQKYLSYLAFSRAEQKLIFIGSLSCVKTLLPEGVSFINPEEFSPQLRRY